MGKGTPPEPRSSSEWLEHFQANEEPDDPAPEGPRLTDDEKRAVIGSIQEFQLGENSEGRHLHRRSREYADAAGDEHYLRAIEYFIREEQRHARYLRDFLATEGAGTLKKTWADTVFRRLRNLTGLEVSIGVLVTAEIIAKVYYAALKEATRSPMLRRICTRISQRRRGARPLPSRAARDPASESDGGWDEDHAPPPSPAVPRSVPRRLAQPRQGDPARRHGLRGLLATVLGRVPLSLEDNGPEELYTPATRRIENRAQEE